MHEAADAVADLGQAIAVRRRHLRLTQQEAAELAGIAVRSVHAIEAGKATSRLDTLLALLAALGLELRLRRGGAPGALAVDVDRARAKSGKDEGGRE